MLRIRLQRVGRKHQALYRIVVAEHARSASKNRLVETLGSYSSTTRPQRFVLNKTLYDKWVAQGAQPTERVKYLVARAEKEGTPKKVQA